MQRFISNIVYWNKENVMKGDFSSCCVFSTSEKNKNIWNYIKYVPKQTGFIIQRASIKKFRGEIVVGRKRVKNETTVAHMLEQTVKQEIEIFSIRAQFLGKMLKKGYRQ